MIDKILSLFQQKEYKRIIENFFSLSILNALSFLFPLITLPFLIRVIGVEKFGTVTFVLTIFQYIILVSNYGFPFSATREISINRTDVHSLSKIFSSVLMIRFAMAFLCYILLLGSMMVFTKIRDEWILYTWGIGIILGDILIPVWLFQGLEKMKYISIVNIISKGLFTILIFVVIRKPQDYPYVILLNAVGYLMAGLFSMYFAYRKFNIRMIKPGRMEIIHQLKEGRHIFFSTLFMNFYRNSNIFILGILTNDMIVGFYASAEKLIKAIQSLISPLSESLYPHFSLRFEKNNIQDNYKVLFKIGKYYFFVLLIISLVVLITAKPLITIFLGSTLTNTIHDLQILSFVILFGGLNYFFGIIGLLNLGYKKQFALFVFISGIISLIICITFSRIFFDKAASFAMLIGEMTLLIMIFSYLLKMHKKSGSAGALV